LALSSKSPGATSFIWATEYHSNCLLLSIRVSCGPSPCCCTLSSRSTGGGSPVGTALEPRILGGLSESERLIGEGSGCANGKQSSTPTENRVSAIPLSATTQQTPSTSRSLHTFIVQTRQTSLPFAVYFNS
jgi:hypothetical protein